MNVICEIRYLYNLFILTKNDQIDRVKIQTKYIHTLIFNFYISIFVIPTVNKIFIKIHIFF